MATNSKQLTNDVGMPPRLWRLIEEMENTADVAHELMYKLREQEKWWRNLAMVAIIIILVLGILFIVYKFMFSTSEEKTESFSENPLTLPLRQPVFKYDTDDVPRGGKFYRPMIEKEVGDQKMSKHSDTKNKVIMGFDEGTSNGYSFLNKQIDTQNNGADPSSHDLMPPSLDKIHKLDTMIGVEQPKMTRNFNPIYDIRDEVDVPEINKSCRSDRYNISPHALSNEDDDIKDGKTIVNTNSPIPFVSSDLENNYSTL